MAVLVLPLGADRKERAVLVVSELTTNAFVHAGGVLYLHIFQYDSGIRLEVADASPRRPGPIKANLTSGRGLQMVEALARAWGGPKPWGKVVWAELNKRCAAHRLWPRPASQSVTSALPSSGSTPNSPIGVPMSSGTSVVVLALSTSPLKNGGATAGTRT